VTARRLALAALGLLLVVLGGLALLPAAPAGSARSSLSRGPTGHRAAAAYLAARGAPPLSLREPASSLPARPADGPVLLALPAGRALDEAGAQALLRFVLAGGTLILQNGGPTGIPEATLLPALGVATARPPVPAALAARWESNPFALLGRESTMAAEAPWCGAATAAACPELVVSTPEQVFLEAPGDEVWAAAADGTAAVRMRRVGRGRFVLVDGALFENRSLGRGGNLLLLESLAAAGPLRLLDRAHGLLPPAPAPPAPARTAMDVLLAHGVFLWAATLAYWGRRLGPGRAPAAPPRGTVGRDLMRLGALLARGPHAAAAGERLWSWISRRPGGVAWLAGRPPPTTPEALVAAAQALAEAQAARRVG